MRRLLAAAVGVWCLIAAFPASSQLLNGPSTGGGGSGCTVSGGSQFNPLVNNGSSGCSSDTSLTINGGTIAATGSSPVSIAVQGANILKITGLPTTDPSTANAYWVTPNGFLCKSAQYCMGGFSAPTGALVIDNGSGSWVTVEPPNYAGLINYVDPGVLQISGTTSPAEIDLFGPGSSSIDVSLAAPGTGSGSFVQTMPGRTGTLVDGAASSTDGHCALFSGTSGNQLKDGGACPGGGGGSLTVQDLLGNSVASTTTLTAGLGDMVSGSAGTAAITHAQITVSSTASGTWNSWGSPVTVQTVCFGTTLTGNVTVALPATTLFTTGQEITIADCGGIGTTGFAIIIAPNGADTIDGVNASVQFSNAWGSLTLKKQATGAWLVKTPNNVAAIACTNQALTQLSANGIWTCSTVTPSFATGNTTGSGNFVLATSPTLVTPALGTPTALVLTNATGLPAASVLSGALANGMTATTQSAADNSTKLATTAYVDRVTPFTAGGNVSLSGPRAYYECTGACTITLPSTPAGEFCVRNANNVSTAITFAAIASVQFENTNLTSYKSANTSIASSGAAGDKICYIGKDSTHYDVWSFNGNWS